MEMGRVEGTGNLTIRRLGTRLAGKWCLVRLLGVGGMGAVYEARHTTGRRVAIKMLHAHLKGNARSYKRFVREAYVANSLAHPAVVPVYDVDVHDDGTPYLIMDLLIGESAEGFRSRQGGRLAAEHVMEIAEVVLEVLIEAHSRGIVHRDLKPANLFITKQGKVRVLDFGIAKCSQFGPVFAATTLNGSLLGTPAFMSPEQARGQWDAVDHQSDLWSLGATLFTLLTGRAVHEATTLNEQWALAMGPTAAKVGDLRNELPERLASTVDGALRFAKDERWPSAAHMYQALTGREPPALSSADIHHEFVRDALSTWSRTFSLKGSAPSTSSAVGRRRRIMALATASLGVLTAITASQWNTAMRVPPSQPETPAAATLTPSNPVGDTAGSASTTSPTETGSQRHDAKSAALPTFPDPRREARPAVWVPKGTVPSRAHASGDPARSVEAPTTVPEHQGAPRRGPTARDEWPRGQATYGSRSNPKRNQGELERPTTGGELEFGALLDVWE